MSEQNEFGPDLLTLTDDEGVAHTFEVLDTLENCDLGIDYRYCSRSLVRYAQEKGVLLNAYTVDDEMIFRDMTRRGIHFITTDLLKPASNEKS